MAHGVYAHKLRNCECAIRLPQLVVAPFVSVRRYLTEFLKTSPAQFYRPNIVTDHCLWGGRLLM